VALEGGTDDGLPFGLSRVSRADGSEPGLDAWLSPFFHRAQKHVGKERSCQPRRVQGGVRFLFGGCEGWV